MDRREPIPGGFGQNVPVLYDPLNAFWPTLAWTCRRLFGTIAYDRSHEPRSLEMGGKILSKSDALELVSRELQSMTTPDEPFVVVDSHTIEKPYGWVFVYNSKRFLETGIHSHRLAGNGPVIVNKYDGTVQFLGSSEAQLEVLAEYDRKQSRIGKDG